MLVFASDVKRGQILEAEDEAENNFSRPKTSSRPDKSCVKQLEPVSVHTTSSKI